METISYPSPKSSSLVLRLASDHPNPISNSVPRLAFTVSGRPITDDEIDLGQVYSVPGKEVSCNSSVSVM